MPAVQPPTPEQTATGGAGDPRLERGVVSPTSLTQAWRQQPWAIAAGLLLGWSTLLLALIWTQFIAALGLIGLLFKGIFGGGSGLVEFLTHTLITLIGSVALSLIGVLRTPGWILLGALITVAIVALRMTAEPWLLERQGARRLSDREARYIAPMVDEICATLGMTRRPAFRVSEKVVPGAWTETRTIILHEGSGLHPEAPGQLTQPEMRALLAHELHHWRQGDTIANRLVWAASLPVYIPYLLAEKIKDASAILGVAAWLMFWPSWVCLHLVLAPLTAARARRNEYAADQAAVAIGEQAGMRTLLEKVRQFEPPRNTWEKVLTAQHPPTELRIEALDAPDVPVEEGTAPGSGWRVPRVAPRAATAIAIPVIGVIAVTAVASGHHHRNHRGSPSFGAPNPPPRSGHRRPSEATERAAVITVASHVNQKSTEAAYDLARSEALTRAYGDPAAMSRLLAETRRSYASNVAKLRPYGRPSDATVSAPTSGTRIDTFDGSTATVSVAALVTVVANAQPLINNCIVQRYRMRRVGRAWKVVDNSNTGHTYHGTCPPPGFQ